MVTQNVLGSTGLGGKERDRTELDHRLDSESTVLLSLDYDRFERFLLAFSESTLKLFKQTVQKFMAQQQLLLTRDAMRKAGAT